MTGETSKPPQSGSSTVTKILFETPGGITRRPLVELGHALFWTVSQSAPYMLNDAVFRGDSRTGDDGFDGGAFWRTSVIGVDSTTPPTTARSRGHPLS
jgi:hypothetical protein